MKHILLFLLVMAAGSATAQPVPEPPAASARGGLWQRLTPAQRMLLWRSLTPEQQADIWRNLEPDERRAMGRHSMPFEPDPQARRMMPNRVPDGGEAGPHMRMSPEERQKMREQIREAHRLRRERLEAERSGRRERR